MSRYTETTNYNLRKPVPNDTATRDRWGTDLNRNIIDIDTLYNDIQAQMNTTEGLTDEMINTTIPLVLTALNNMLDRIQPLVDRLEPYLDNPDCEAQAQIYLAQLEGEYTDWIDAHILRLQRFNSGTHYETVTTDIPIYNVSQSYSIVFDNGLLKSYSITT